MKADGGNERRDSRIDRDEAEPENMDSTDLGWELQSRDSAVY